MSKFVVGQVVQLKEKRWGLAAGSCAVVIDTETNPAGEIAFRWAEREEVCWYEPEVFEAIPEQAVSKEAVAHPQHYGGDTTYEAIKVIEAWGLGFHAGNTVKYISRAGKKDPAKELEDIDKAIWYLQRHRSNLAATTNA